jgi:dihydroxy-acid dehydratase
MPPDHFDGRPVIGLQYIQRTDTMQCHFREHAESVKRGVLEAADFL